MYKAVDVSRVSPSNLGLVIAVHDSFPSISLFQHKNSAIVVDNGPVGQFVETSHTAGKLQQGARSPDTSITITDVARLACRSIS
jgi:hypothetical protein